MSEDNRVIHISQHCEVDRIFGEVAAEIIRAEEKHPRWPSNVIEGAAIMAEESGEAIRAALQLRYEGGEQKPLEDELIQTAAMSIRMLLFLRRQW